ncbi:aldehyde oxidoreductase [Halobacteriales archaeon QH_6_64_20]|jgi:2,5-diketo-D-gluconate reductase B|nr:MAG: aldehyde oxidoreductase [Halobacteriales archaeon QH_6_64_20]
MPIEMPRLGLGTHTDDDRARRRDAVSDALDLGYRHIDTAEVYGNERYVGRGIEDADVDREEIFLATKTVHHDVPERVEAVRDAIEGCLDRLGVTYVDLLYVHWPTGVYEAEPVLETFEECYEEGLIENIGVSNFLPEQLMEAREVLDAPIAAHQFEAHPLLPQEELRADAREHDYWAVAYSPLAKNAVADDGTLVEIANDRGVSAQQVSLAWLLSKENVAVVPRATSRGHLADNLAALDLDLTTEERERIEDIGERKRVIDPERAPWN